MPFATRAKSRLLSGLPEVIVCRRYPGPNAVVETRARFLSTALFARRSQCWTQFDVGGAIS